MSRFESITIREIESSDLETFYEHQLDPLLCSIVIVAQYATAADSPWAGAVEIKARWAPAIVVALREFQAHQGTRTDKGEPVYGDLRHYTIEMIPRGEILSVTFAPELSPRCA